MENLLVGGDPEVFVIDEDGLGVPAWGLIPGTKEDPHYVDHGAVQVDGFALEINIEPADNADDFAMHTTALLEQLERLLVSQRGEGYKLSITPSMNFSHYRWEDLPDEAMEVGCVPDYNAYTEGVNMNNPSFDRDFAMHELGGVITRHAGGHGHVSWTKDQEPLDVAHFSSCCMLARQYDIGVSIPALEAENKGGSRIHSYGKAGNFRPKPYGIEYRTPSNWWLKDPISMKLFFNQLVRSFDMLVDEDVDYYTLHGFYSYPQNILNYSGGRRSHGRDIIKKLDADPDTRNKWIDYDEFNSFKDCLTEKDEMRSGPARNPQPWADIGEEIRHPAMRMAPMKRFAGVDFREEIEGEDDDEGGWGLHG